MQSPSSQPGWLTNLLNTIMSDGAARRPIGLFDPRESSLPQAANPSALPGASPPASDPLGGYASTKPDGSDALVQRILDHAASRRPAMGLFDPREPGLPQAPTPSAFRGAPRSAFDPQSVYASATPDGSNALVQRILDNAASKRPPMGLFDPRELDTVTAANNTPAMARADRSPGVISFIPPIAPPPGYNTAASTAERLAPALRATGFDFSPTDLGLAANALGRAAYQGLRTNLSGMPAPSRPPTSTGSQIAPIPIPRGELSEFEIVKRIPGGGASDDDAYRHWYEGSGNPLRIEFSGADVENDLKSAIGESAAGGLEGTFRNKINESLLTGRPAFVNTMAPVDTGDIVRGRVGTGLTGWVTTDKGQWQFDGTATGRPERFDFDPDATRGFGRNAAAIYAGDRGHLYGAKDYETTYAGAIQLRAGGKIRR